MCKKVIHFSVDDTLGCFRWLTVNEQKINSIFESYVFGFAKDIYERYGIPTSFYVMYTDGCFTLKDVPDKWQKEFQDSCEWMKLGFHAFDGASNYGNADKQRIANDYFAVSSELRRISGGNNCITDCIRLHYFAGNEVTIDYLAKQGIRRFLCADDNRGSYDLLKPEEEKMKLDGSYFSEKHRCEFVPTNIRIEKIKDVACEIEKASALPGNTLEIFTHEKYLGNEEMRKTMISLFDGLQKGV